MAMYSDEPVLMVPTARSRVWRWVAVVAVLLGTGLVIAIPWQKAQMEKRAHDATRGTRGGVVVKFTAEGTAYTLELPWYGDYFAPILTPIPVAGTMLRMEGRMGPEEVLAWKADPGCFGPSAHKISPYDHYKLRLSLERAGQVLWRDTVWAYGFHDTHGHSH
jgi:hypothetical protein